MISGLTEAVVEEAALEWFVGLGYTVLHGSVIAPGEPAAEREGYGEVALTRRLRDALKRLNPGLPAEALEDAFRKVLLVEGPSLEARNRAFHRLLVRGVTVEYRRPDGSIAGDQACLIDFEDPDGNDWLVVNQFSVVENRHTRRPDVVVFVNGLPLALIELKNAADEDATIWKAFEQLQTYKAELPSLFAFNELLAVSDSTEARLGTLTAGKEWFKPWRTVSGEAPADSRVAELQVLIQGVFEKRRFLDLLRHFLVFEDDGSGALVKKVAGCQRRVSVSPERRAGSPLIATRFVRSGTDRSIGSRSSISRGDRG